MSKYTPFQNQSIEEHFERHRQLREHSCPVGCHQKSMYPPSQYHEYECEHQKQHKTRERLFAQWRWLQGHIAELKNQGKDTSYWKNQNRSILNQLQTCLDLWTEEHTAREERAKAMPHIYR